MARFLSSYLHDHTDYGSFPFIIPLRSLSVTRFRLLYLHDHIDYGSRFRSSYLYDHTDCGTLHHTCTIILTVARFLSSYLYDHTDYGSFPFIIPLRSLSVTRFRLSYLYDHTDCGTLHHTCTIIPAKDQAIQAKRGDRQHHYKHMFKSQRGRRKST